MRTRELFTVIALLLALGAAAGSAGAAGGTPSVSLLSWHRSGQTEYLSLRLCGRSGPQKIQVTESSTAGSRRLTFATSTTSTGCSARSVYWQAGKPATGRTTIAVQIRDRDGAVSRVVKRSQVV